MEIETKVQPDKPLIVGFSGKIGVGKDYVATKVFLPILNIAYGNDKNILFLAFADRLKAECVARHGTPYEKLYVTKDSITRTRLQDIGDEYRERFGETYFSDWMRLQIELHSKRSNINVFVITDVRFPEEVKLIHDLGGFVYRIEAPTRNMEKLKDEFGCNRQALAKRANHRSEILLDKCQEFDGVIHNDPSDNPKNECSSLILSMFAKLS